MITVKDFGAEKNTHWNRNLVHLGPTETQDHFLRNLPQFKFSI